MKSHPFARIVACTFTAMTMAMTLVPGAAAQATPLVQVASAPPVINSGPASIRALAGNPAVFAVYASGSGLFFQWQEKTVGHLWATISGATGNRLTVTASPGRNQAEYRALVSNAGGRVISVAGTLTVVTPAPRFTRQPASVRVESGTAASFSAAASGYAISYHWQVKAPGQNWSNIAGATRSSYGLSAGVSRNGFQFRVVVSNSGGQVVSSPVSLSVIATRKDPYRAGTRVTLTGWQVAQAATETNVDAEVKEDDLGDPPAPGNHYVSVRTDVRYLGSGSEDPYDDLDVDFIGGDGRTYSNSSGLFFDDDIYSVGPLYHNASGAFYTIIEVPNSAITGGRWRIDDTTDYSAITTAWYALG